MYYLDFVFLCEISSGCNALYTIQVVKIKRKKCLGDSADVTFQVSKKKKQRVDTIDQKQTKPNKDIWPFFTVKEKRNKEQSW